MSESPTIRTDPPEPQISLKDKIVFRVKNSIQSAIISLLGLKVTLSSGITIRIESYADWIIYNEIFVDGEYREAVDLALSTLDKDRPPSFVDLGANVGFFTLYLMDALRRHCPGHLDFDVKAIEASPSVFQKLQSRVAPEAKSGEQIQLYNGLVGSRSGTGTLFEIGYHAMSSMIPRRFSRATRVPFVNLEDVCSDVETIDLLKCDIEGAEEEFLTNWKDVISKTRCAVFEFHPAKCNTGICVTALLESGLRNREILHANNDASVELFWR
jgi:FkbM family methyltransferase